MTTRRRPTSPQPRPSERHRPWAAVSARGVVVLALALLVLAGLPGPAAADPDYPGPVLYGLDPVLRTTKDPRLLGVDRMVMRERLLAQGVDPLKDARRPGLDTIFRKIMETRLGLDLERVTEVSEASGFSGLYTVIRYPNWFFLFPTARKLPGGFSYFPARQITDPAVEIFVDDIDLALDRHWAVQAKLSRLTELDVAGGGKRSGGDDGLINLTIPIKLPRTLEKIIGRGEKTRIKISGREHISINGETTVSNQFTASEYQQSQSLFPDLDMKQQLQVNLSGQIGEKIFIEVDHNSEAIGPEGTKIKLSYVGDEDEIIQSIETGDVGLTLPGGQLLGYSSSQSGLFGVRVAGQLGPVDFTVVAAKQKAESDSKSFNSRGGQVSEHVIPSYAYLNNRFFRLDLPAYVGSAHERLGYTIPDSPGRTGNEVIDPTSVRVYRNLGAVTPREGDVQYAAAAIDSSGRWDETIDNIPIEDWVQSWVWRPVEVTFLRNATDNSLVAVDLRQQMLDSDILAVTYDVIDADTRDLIYRVGEDPIHLDLERNLVIDPLDPDSQRYYRFKLLKPASTQRDPFTFQYVLRNIYSLGGSNIDVDSFELRIEVAGQGENRDYNTSLPYVRLFGLDLETEQGDAVPDGKVDTHRPEIFDFPNGLLKFPLDFPFPFAAESEDYQDYAGLGDDEWSAEWDGSDLEAQRTPEIYDSTTSTNLYDDYGKFQIVAVHAAASSTISLGASSIEEGSETVTLDGRTLQRDSDYEIDYFLGEVRLKGQAAADLTPDSNIQVNYQYSPFFGGGQASLLGMNLGYDLGLDSRLTSTWLYESNNIVGNKARLGEEPSKTLVGNMRVNHTLRSGLLTDVANIVARGRRDKESTVVMNGEAAISIPNPNTRDKVYLEDFEGAASTDLVSLSRLGWYLASRPVHASQSALPPGDTREFQASDRVGDMRWYRPDTAVLRRWLNPELQGEERNETQQALELYVRDEDGWTDESWGGIMRGLSRTGVDLSKSQFLEFWVNDFTPEVGDRHGRLHIDFGVISEDFMWPETGGVPEYATEQREDLNADSIFNVTTEDVGLDAEVEGQTVIREGELFQTTKTVDGVPGIYPYINNTQGNNYEDSEDLDGNTTFDTQNNFFTVTVDLETTDPLVDVAQEYPDSELQGTAWRKYQIRLSDLLEVNESASADLEAVRHIRIWFEDGDGAATDSRRLQLSELTFLGSRWQREGIRKTSNEELLGPEDIGPNEGFFIGAINNKDNPDYAPPFPIRSENDIPEKESALILDFTNLEPDHMFRASKQVSAGGDDYTRYDTMTWWWHCGDADVADLDMFYRIGADSTNYYEVGLRFIDTPERRGWRHVSLDIAELTNLKNELPGEDGVIHTEINDTEDDQPYGVRIVGAPDLRRVTRYYLGVANPTRRLVSGQVWVNDVMLLGAKREIGLAESLGLQLNMADVFKFDADWSRRDAEYHGLNQDAGQGAVTETWSFSTNFKVDDFIPLLGFQIPVSLGRRQSTSRPKYEINSDIEILDEDRRNQFSSVEDRNSFSVRLSHSQSRSAISRYVIDPWTFSLSGSVNSKDSPTVTSDQTSLQGGANFNLRIPDSHTLGDLPGLGLIPIVKSVAYLPTRIEGAASFVNTDRKITNRSLTGVIYDPTRTVAKPGNLTSGMEYRVLPIVTVNYSNRSERDLLRRQEWNGINIGEQNKFSQDFSVNFSVPKPNLLPDSKIFAPLRAGLRGLNKLRPSVTYQGSYINQMGPSVGQVGDPEDVHSVSNGNDWQFRAQFPLGDLFDKIVPEPRRTQNVQKELDAELSRIMQEARRDTALTFNTGEIDDWDSLTPDQKRREEDEWWEEKALERLRAEGRDPGSGGGGGALTPRAAVEPLLSMLRGFDPVSMSLTQNRNSGFGRLSGEDVGLGYRLGFLTNPDLPDTSYVYHRFTESRSFTVSTKTRIAQDVSLDFKYGLNTSHQLNDDSQTWNYTQDWPDLRLSLAGIEKLGIFGGVADDREAGWFRSSSFDIAYKHSKSVPGYTETYHNPRRTTTITPRWNMTFQSGMSLTFNGSLSRENQVSSGTRSRIKRFQIGTQLQHEFDAQGFLAKMGLYRPGNQPSINMSVDLRFTRNTTDREVPGAIYEQATQGTQNIAFQPRFSYNITRNLSGAFSINFNQTKNLATDLKTTSVGIGMEATFVF